MLLHMIFCKWDIRKLDTAFEWIRNRLIEFGFSGESLAASSLGVGVLAEAFELTECGSPALARGSLYAASLSCRQTFQGLLVQHD
jgi:hypothetical protein